MFIIKYLINDTSIYITKMSHRNLCLLSLTYIGVKKVPQQYLKRPNYSLKTDVPIVLQ